MVTRTEIINKLIADKGYKSYLEIGVQTGKNWEKIICENKTGVDPCFPDSWNPTVINIEPTFKMTSDEFFKQNKKTFDVVFIDGLHHWQQVYEDIINSLSVLNEGGTIVCHDMNPATESQQQVPRIQRIWNGDCWKAWVKLRAEHSDLLMYVVNTDEGCGIIQKGTQELLKINCEMTYINLEANRVEWLNLREPQLPIERQE